jgi:plasmid stabilization system protein ParE
LKVSFLEAARADLREAAAYYEGQRRGLGRDFRNEVLAAIERIKAFPEAWHPLSENTRRCRTHRFPYGVIYLVQEEHIVIVAVAHLHREPGRWKDRL